MLCNSSRTGLPARFYNKSTSTICTLLKKKEEIKALDAAKGVMRVPKQRPRVLEVFCINHSIWIKSFVLWTNYLHFNYLLWESSLWCTSVLDYKHVYRTDYAHNPRFYCTAIQGQYLNLQPSASGRTWNSMEKIFCGEYDKIRHKQAHNFLTISSNPRSNN
jgi:hypothetical protein